MNKSAAIVGLYAAVISGCASGTRTAVVPAASASTAQRFESLKQLAGRWEMSMPAGEAPAVCEFKVIAGGSTLVETMFPGQPHEMINMYTVDGDAIVATHYCAAGNQPHMKLAGGSATDFPFVSTGVTNLHSRDEDHMMDVRIVMHTPDHVTTSWRGQQKGKVGEHAVFDFKRVK
ncbi:MAG: hypothetical protein ACOYN0_05585 [Phycisphaerales bacterium]